MCVLTVAHACLHVALCERLNLPLPVHSFPPVLYLLVLPPLPPSTTYPLPLGLATTTPIHHPSSTSWSYHHCPHTPVLSLYASLLNASFLLFSDFDSDDLEQLAKSASEDEDDDNEDDDDGSENESHADQSKNAKGGKQAKKRKQEASATSSKVKRGKVEIEDDSGDIVQDFQLSDFESD